MGSDGDINKTTIHTGTDKIEIGFNPFKILHVINSVTMTIITME